MQSEYVIITWNIQGEAALGWDWDEERRKIRKEVVDKVIQQDAQIIVLTAFVVTAGVEYLFEQLQRKKYIWFFNSQTGKNGVLVAIKKELVVKQQLIDQVYHDNIVSSEFDGCNILKVTVPLRCDKSLCIIGCRMETGLSEDLEKNYNLEKENFDKILVSYIEAVEQNDLCIVCGDFNNGKCRGKLNEKFHHENYIGYAQCNFNLNLLKDYFENQESKFVMADIKDGQPIPTHKNYFPDDHIFVHGLNVIECKTVPVGSLSDHDILWAKVIPQE